MGTPAPTGNSLTVNQGLTLTNVDSATLNVTDLTESITLTVTNQAVSAGINVTSVSVTIISITAANSSAAILLQVLQSASTTVQYSAQILESRVSDSSQLDVLSTNL